MSNIAGKAYAMNVLTPIPRGKTRVQAIIFLFVRAFPALLSGLLGLKLIHFARWVIIRRDQWPDLGQGRPVLAHDYLLFLSNFNGTWDQYIDAFADGIPGGLDLIWYTSVKYPHSIPISTFKAYIGHNQIQTNYYYTATPGAAQRDIKAALRVRSELAALAAIHRQGDVAAFASAFAAATARLANSLAAPGFAPIASVATGKADAARWSYIRALAAARGHADA